MYRLLIRPLLYCLPAETAHHLAIFALNSVAWIPGARWLLRACFQRKTLPVKLGHLIFPSPVGMAAGFDKNAQVYHQLGDLGFGFVEIGTVTLRPQTGNPKPRLFRLIKDQALINRMGFNNDGAERIVKRIQGPRAIPLGVNIGKNKDTSEENAAKEYAQLATLLGPHADYLVVNVSSPNTPGLRLLQQRDKLMAILSETKQAIDALPLTTKPLIFVKIAPDLDDQDVIEVADLCMLLGIDGIVATNTTLSRDGLQSSTQSITHCGAGGLSGTPVKHRSLQVLKLLRAHAGERLHLISVGGIDTPDDVIERLRAGAQLVQIYTSLVYQGPCVAVKLTPRA